ncbi:MAG: SRPBCC domain-containing protein [Pseudomonadota bacterium]
MTTRTIIDKETLTVERIYDAGQADVFDAWVDATKTAHWWGCQNTSKVQSTINAQEGGAYRHLMHIDGVGEYLIDAVMLELRPPEYLAYRLPAEGPMSAMIVKVTFTSLGDQTRVVLVQSPLPDVLQETVAAGWTASFERLSDFFAGERRAA